MSLDNAPAATSAPPAAPSSPSGGTPNWDAFASGADMNHAPAPAPEPRAPSPATGNLSTSSSSSQPSAAPTSPAAAPADWRSRYQTRGVDVSRYQSEDDFYAEVAAYQRERPQLEQYAQIGAQLAPHAQRFAEWAQAQQQVREPQAADEPEVDPLEQAWGAPPYDPQWESQIIVDEQTGEVRPRHALVSWQAVEGYKKYHEHQRKKAVEFFNNPFKQTYQALEPKFKDIVRAEFEQLQRQHQAQSALHQFEQQNAGWLYQADAAGRVLYNPVTAQPVLSPMGQQFAQHVQYLRQVGVTDPVAIATLAANNLSAQITRLQTQVPQPPPQAQQPRAANGQFISPASAPPPNPPASPEQASQNRIGHFLANAHQNAAYATPSFNGGPDPAGGNWNVRNDRDLDHRFFAALDRAAGIGH